MKNWLRWRNRKWAMASQSHRICVADSSSYRHLSQVGSSDSPSLKRCSLRWQCPVSSPTTHWWSVGRVTICTFCECLSSHNLHVWWVLVASQFACLVSDGRSTICMFGEYLSRHNLYVWWVLVASQFARLLSDGRVTICTFAEWWSSHNLHVGECWPSHDLQMRWAKRMVPVRRYAMWRKMWVPWRASLGSRRLGQRRAWRTLSATWQRAPVGRCRARAHCCSSWTSQDAHNKAQRCSLVLEL
jgi:hypothetical protein